MDNLYGYDKVLQTASEKGVSVDSKKHHIKEMLIFHFGTWIFNSTTMKMKR